MTVALDQHARHQLLDDRLTQLRAEHAEASTELRPQLCGDDADRATNVEAHLRVAMIENQIARIERELSAGLSPHRAAADDVAQVGDTVTVDLGDGPEDFLLASVEQRGDDLDVITPESPLGRALLGAAAGTDVEFTASRRTVRARLLQVAA